MLLVAQISVRFISIGRLLARAGRPLRRLNRFNGEQTVWVSWAVEAMGQKRWIRADSLSRALAAQTMLRRRGIASRLCLGVVCDGEELIAHAWVECGREIITGNAGAAACIRMAEFGEGRA